MATTNDKKQKSESLSRWKEKENENRKKTFLVSPAVKKKCLLVLAIVFSLNLISWRPIMAVYEESTTSGTSGLIDYLNNERQVDQKCIDMLKKEHIDESTLPMMSEEELTAYLPLKGDRLAARRFCSKTCDKRTLLDRLRGKFSKNDIGTNRINGGRGTGNEHAAKAYRIVEIGWMDYCHSTGSYKQVRSQKGGGTRVVKFAKMDNVLDVLDKGKNLFFPKGVCKKGPVSNFSFKVCDFKQTEVDDKTTIASLYSVCHMRTLRLYICSKGNESDSSENELPTIQNPKKKKMSITSLSETKGHEKYVDGIPKSKTPGKERATATYLNTELRNGRTTEGNLHVPDIDMSSIDIVAMAAASAEVSPESDLHMTDLHYQDSDISFDIPCYVPEENVITSDLTTSPKFAWSSQLLKGPLETEPDRDTQAHQPAVQDEPQTSDAHEQTQVQFRDPECLNQTQAPLTRVYDDRSMLEPLSFHAISSTDHMSYEPIRSPVLDPDGPTEITGRLLGPLAQPSPSGSLGNFFVDSVAYDTENVDHVVMTVHRGSTAFHEVIGYFKDPEISNKTITVIRVLPNGDKEMAEDSGGVMRDLLSEFWSYFYELCTVGRDVKVPTLRHDIGPVEWQAIGRILVYGYTVTKYWPIKLAKSFVLSTISAVDVGTEDLLQDFWKYVAVSDKDNFEQSCKEYGSVPYEELLDSLDSYDCRTAPNANNIKPILLEIAHTQLIQKPTFVSNCMREELLKANIENSMVEEIYDKIEPTSRKVIRLIQFPDSMDGMQLEVAAHLKRYIKDMDKEKLGLFLRFCTGSDLLTVDKITVEFTSLVGLQRRPIAHTCGCVLELPKMYESFVEFRFEFDSIFRHNIWVMDSI